MSHRREPIRNTCPDINKYIRWINSEIVNDYELTKLTQEELIETASSMSQQLKSCIDYLEELRSSNQTLRDWGGSEAEKVDELENEVQELKYKIEEIEDSNY